MWYRGPSDPVISFLWSSLLYPGSPSYWSCDLVYVCYIIFLNLSFPMHQFSSPSIIVAITFATLILSFSKCKDL